MMYARPLSKSEAIPQKHVEILPETRLEEQKKRHLDLVIETLPFVPSYFSREGAEGDIPPSVRDLESAKRRNKRLGYSAMKDPIKPVVLQRVGSEG